MERTELRVDLLGGLRVRVGDREIPPSAWTRRKARALIAILALTPGHRAHRERLMDALFPKLDPIAAAANLRKVVHVARRTLDADPDGAARLLVSEGDTVALAEHTLVDVEGFEAAAGEARAFGTPDAYRAATDRYAGDLLPEDRYEEWVVARHDELRGEFLSLMGEEADLREARGELDVAASLLRRIVAEDPSDESNQLRLIRVLALTGRRGDALDQFERFREALARELDAEPSPEAMRLREEIAAKTGLEPSLTRDLWERVGDLRLLAGDAVGAAAAFAAAAPTGDMSPERARRLEKAARAHLMGHDPDAAEPLLDEAESLGDGSFSARLAVLRANAAWERGDIPTAAARAEEALKLAEADGSVDDAAEAHEALAIVSHFRGEWRDGLHEEIERLGVAPDRDHALVRVFDIHHCIGQYHLYGDGLWEGVEDYARDTLSRAERLGAVRAQAFAWCLLGESLLLRGRFEEAAGCLQRSGEMHTSLGSRSGALPWQRLAELEVATGALDRASEHLHRASAIATVSPMARHLWGRIHATAALAALARDDPADAARIARAAGAAAARYGNCPTCSALLHPVAATAFAALERPDEIHPHVEAATAVAGMFESSAWRAMAASTTASLREAEGDRNRAEEAWAQAAELYERGGQSYWAERARSNAERVRGNGRGTPAS